MHGFVLYTDGGSRPTNGFGGAGIHGYTWDSDITYKGVGLLNYVLTPMGYEHKAQAPIAFSQELKSKPQLSELGIAEFMDKFHKHRVTPVAFHDYAFPLGWGVSNNVAELLATIHGLQTAIAYHKTQRKLDSIYIRSDSKYVVEVVMDNMETWMANNFTLSGGEPTKNIEQVVQMITLVREIEELGIYLGRKHVFGHSDCPGNDAADRYATTAVYMSRSKMTEPLSVVSTTEQYWKSANESRHPLLSHRFMYFDNYAANRERGIYYVGNQGREIDLLGKRESDGAYGVVRLKNNHVGEIESIVDKQHQLPTIAQTVVMMDLDVIYGDHYRFIVQLGGHYLRQNSESRNDLITQNKTLVTREYFPAMLAHRVYDNVFKLESILNSYLNEPDTLQITDITSTFFDVEEVKVKGKKAEVDKSKPFPAIGFLILLDDNGNPISAEENYPVPSSKAPKTVSDVKLNFKIKDDVIVGMTYIDIVGNFLGEDQKPFQEVVRLNMGIDLPVRNAVRKLADRNPKISLVSWRIGVDFHNYAVVIDCNDAIAIYAGMASNLKITGAAAQELDAQRKRIETERSARLAKKAPKKE